MSKKSEYVMLYEEIKQHIRNGEIAPGAKLPSEREMMESRQLSRTTIRGALGLLEKENYVVKRPGIGCIVQTPDDGKSRNRLRIGTNLTDSSDQSYTTLIHEELIRIGAAENIDFILRGEGAAADRDLDGMILTRINPPEFEALEKSADFKFPVVLINRMTVHPRFAYFAVDYRGTARKIVSRLLRNGARKIALIGASDRENETLFANHARTLGWSDAYQEQLGKVPKELIFWLDELRKYGGGLGSRLKETRPEVLFVANSSLLAVTGVLLRQAGLTPGKEVDVVCFDNIEKMTTAIGFPVSYVKMPFGAMLRNAVDYIRSARPGDAAPKRMMEPQLVVDHCNWLF